MSGLGEITTSFGLNEEIRTILVPGWPQQPRVEARQDGRNAVTVVVAKCHSHEAWRLVQLRHGVLCAIVYLTGGKSLEGRRLTRTDYDMVVQLPPDKVDSIRVLTKAPDKADDK